MRIPQHFFLVDDSLGDRLLAEEAFDQLCPDCTLTTVASGETALRMLRTKSVIPDVILLDINMPGMNGFELLQALKDDDDLAQIPVVMLSTSGAPGDIERAYSLQASSYLMKSPNFQAFLKQIDAFLKYWGGAQVAYAAE
ncbi:response regulator [Deinococcus hopiensis]|uniref:CheY chemotaxis protein or a CheY-like REC (Receiver) domain n=1 Tax=Deinococcus hopiensis KR-140 TaxID=695939 RepID=A0A1W1UVL4_9DEIO|nr:response regulator [Deinococcus hopiensis]SMB85208.1 CheY chemotaxis protein or a CheY-like REC (receiver) domain [Deinococcus hopiensis KR-140]